MVGSFCFRYSVSFVFYVYVVEIIKCFFVYFCPVKRSLPWFPR